MQLHSTLIAAAVLAPLALAAPTPADEQSGSVSAFSISQVPVAKAGFARNGPRQYAKTLRKYNVNVPGPVKQAAANLAAANLAAALGSGSAPADPQASDQAYLSPVQIGTPPTTVNLDFDTGSADLWVFSDELTAQEQAGHDVYKTNQAKLQSGSSWDISYGDGSGASGTVYADTVEIGGVTATSQAVEAATSVSSTFTDDTDIDGLVGLAFSTINTVRPRPAKTFFDTVKASLDQPVFAAWLKPGAPGAYDFGALNQSHYTGEIGYADVNPENGFWQVTGGAVSAGTTNIGNLGDTVVDTGTSIILAPTAIVRAYYAQVSGAQNSRQYGGYVYSCNTQLPDLTINFGGADRTVPGDVINYARAGNNVCFGGIQTNQGLPFTILGDTFLKTQYVVFDGGATPRVGFATSA